jgi:hypothetical protein
MAVDPTTTIIAGDPDSFPEEGYLPTDTTRSFSSRYGAPIEVLYDRTAWNRKNNGVGWRPLDLNGAGDSGGGTPQWTRVDAVTGGNRFGYLQSDITPTGRLSWYVPMPAHLKPLSIRAHVFGDDGAGTNTALPGVAPEIRLYDQKLDGSVASLLYTAPDPDASTTLGVYNAYHNWKLTVSLVQTYVVPYYYIVEFAGHSGGGAGVNTLKLVGIELELGLK